MPTITPHPRRLIRELPASLRPATRLARVGSNQLTITELIAIVLNINIMSQQTLVLHQR